MSASGAESFRPLSAPPIEGPSQLPCRPPGLHPQRRVQRDLFPLPFPQTQQSVVGVARPSRRALRRRRCLAHADAWAADGVAVLNDLHGACTPPSAPNARQQRVQSHIVESCQGLDRPPGGPDFERGALSELLSGTTIYASDSGPVVPHSFERISWPSRDCKPVPVLDLLSPADASAFKDWRGGLLRPPAEAAALRAEACPRRAYVDPSLSPNPFEYAKFLFQAHSRGMLSFQPARGQKGAMGVFWPCGLPWPSAAT
ncbi:unnamed protein product [Prorocentrum cordatum]|uniref:Uncharacterized protein n=1 Tax=Prorocentrum cordatum TaxID=2364126 RepID=A0ABN9TV44_9DINO|nr:unnamed protein product [Polarella glacialis]